MKAIMAKDIEILIKYPDTFLTENDLSGLGMLGRAFRDSIEEIVKREVVQKIIAEIETPKIEINKEELKQKVISLMAEKIIENSNNEYGS